jgi:hypothetical protein
VAVLALGAAGCGGSGDGMSNASAQSSSPAATTAGSAPTTPGTGTPRSSTAPPGATAPAGAPTASAGAPGSTSPPGTARAQAAGTRCTVTDLKMRLGRGDPGAGQVYYPLRFTNTSAHTCVLDGFPGVSLLRGDGSTIGKPADREGATGRVVVLKPGATAEADLHTLNQGIKGNSCWHKPTLLKVYPPGSKDSLTLATSSPVVCGDTFDVGTVH